MLIAESSPELVRTHRQVRAVAKPRLDLVVETTLLKFGNKSLEVAEIGLRQGGRNQSRRFGRYDLPDNTLQRAANVVKDTHHTLQSHTLCLLALVTRAPVFRPSYNASLSTAEFRDSILARLHALHQSVGLINRGDWTGVRLHELLQTEFAPVADRINVSGRNALLKPHAAQSLSLLFYELMTNSSKHGALSKREGTVTEEWEIKDSDSGRLFCFRWQEHDHGIIKPPTRQGFGTKLLTRLVPGDLSGRAALNFEPGVFRYDLEAPAERVVEQETDAAVNVKAVVPLRVTCGHLGADELGA